MSVFFIFGKEQQRDSNAHPFAPLSKNISLKNGEHLTQRGGVCPGQRQNIFQKSSRNSAFFNLHSWATDFWLLRFSLRLRVFKKKVAWNRSACAKSYTCFKSDLSSRQKLSSLGLGLVQCLQSESWLLLFPELWHLLQGWQTTIFFFILVHHFVLHTCRRTKKVSLSRTIHWPAKMRYKNFGAILHESSFFVKFVCLWSVIGQSGFCILLG